ncbi:MAG: hypothetical protein RAO92_07600 [Candidatus Euphemobacter frigidus]|nr:hypothetical protein [Candidatus Euphemobacter frigidus]MDP8276251.1 hypothetical protein [Candidatus Euphemobacter frigidus]
MAEQLQELIERINREGVESAEKKASKIIKAAEERAKKIVDDADDKAGELVGNAQTEAKSIQENAEKAIRQSFRNIMISLKDEIRKYLDTILKKEIGESLSPEALSKIILTVSTTCAEQIKGDKEVNVLISPADAKKIAESLLDRLKKEAGTKVKIKPVPNIDAGFMISFDGGKSSYDFTDQGLQELLSAYISAQLKKIISGK